MTKLFTKGVEASLPKDITPKMKIVLTQSREAIRSQLESRFAWIVAIDKTVKDLNASQTETDKIRKLNGQLALMNETLASFPEYLNATREFAKTFKFDFETSLEQNYNPAAIAQDNFLNNVEIDIYFFIQGVQAFQHQINKNAFPMIYATAEQTNVNAIQPTRANSGPLLKPLPTMTMPSPQPKAEVMQTQTTNSTIQPAATNNQYFAYNGQYIPFTSQPSNGQSVINNTMTNPMHPRQMSLQTGNLIGTPDRNNTHAFFNANNLQPSTPHPINTSTTLQRGLTTNVVISSINATELTKSMK